MARRIRYRGVERIYPGLEKAGIRPVAAEIPQKARGLIAEPVRYRGIPRAYPGIEEGLARKAEVPKEVIRPPIPEVAVPFEWKAEALKKDGERCFFEPVFKREEPSIYGFGPEP